MILGTAGHIDHGKTTLVRALTGVDTDRLPEEKRRGITIELGFAPLVLDGFGTLGVVDVPGHEAFVRTMVAGATGIDLALVVIAADEGIMPQTREHLAILNLLGVRRGVVALTKVDLVDEDWLALVEEDVRSVVDQTLPGAPIVWTSARTGQGLDGLRAALTELARAVPARVDDDLFRLPVDRAFSIKGTGTVATGTVWSGRLARDETVRILPGDRTARVRAIQGHGSQVDVAIPGTRMAIALAAVDVAEVPRGSTIVTDTSWRCTTLALADVTLLPGYDVALRPRTWHRFHVGTTEVGVRIVARKNAANSGAIGARLVFDAPVPLRAGDRFVVRTSAPLNTIAGGVIVDPYAAKRARPWPPGLTAEQRLAQLVDEAGTQGLDVGSLPVRLGRPPAECRALLSGNADLAVAAGLVVSAGELSKLVSQLVAAVDAHHAAVPLDPGVPAQALRDRLHGSERVVEAALERALANGAVVSSGGSVSRPGWEPKPTNAQAAAVQTIVSLLGSAGFEPPSVEELSRVVGGDALALLRFLERSGRVTQTDSERYYDSTHLKSLLDKLHAALPHGTALGPSELRDALGISRKYLIPFLEYCDRVGYTNREASGRSWRGP